MVIDFPSSREITPSLPTLSIALAIISPTSSSLPAAIVPHCAMAVLSLIGFEFSSIFPTRNSVALSIPFFRVIALAPAATFLKPAFTIA